MTGIQSFRPREERLRDIASCQCLLMSGTVWVTATSTKDKQRQEATFHREEGRLREEKGRYCFLPVFVGLLTITHSKRKIVQLPITSNL
jgi:hypothetical protein